MDCQTQIEPVTSSASATPSKDSRLNIYALRTRSASGGGTVGATETGIRLPAAQGLAGETVLIPILSKLFIEGAAPIRFSLWRISFLNRIRKPSSYLSPSDHWT